MGRGVTEEARYGPCASCGEPTYGLRHARCEAEALRLAREAEEANECPEGCGRPAHAQGGPCTYCWHSRYDRED